MLITPKGAFSTDNLSLVLHSCKCTILTNELKKLNAIEVEGVEPSVLIQDTTHKLFGIWEIDWSTVWLMNSCCCLVIFGFPPLSFLDAQ